MTVSLRRNARSTILTIHPRLATDGKMSIDRTISILLEPEDRSDWETCRVAKRHDIHGLVVQLSISAGEPLGPIDQSYWRPCSDKMAYSNDPVLFEMKLPAPYHFGTISVVLATPNDDHHPFLAARISLLPTLFDELWRITSNGMVTSGVSMSATGFALELISHSWAESRDWEWHVDPNSDSSLIITSFGLSLGLAQPQPGEFGKSEACYLRS